MVGGERRTSSWTPPSASPVPRLRHVVAAQGRPGLGNRVRTPRERLGMCGQALSKHSLGTCVQALSKHHRLTMRHLSVTAVRARLRAVCQEGGQAAGKGPRRPSKGPLTIFTYLHATQTFEWRASQHFSETPGALSQSLRRWLEPDCCANAGNDWVHSKRHSTAELSVRGPWSRVSNNSAVEGAACCGTNDPNCENNNYSPAAGR